MKRRNETFLGKFLMAAACALAAIPVAAAPARAEDAKPAAKGSAAKGSSSLDDELLKELDDAVGGKPRAKHDHGGGKPDSADAAPAGKDNDKDQDKKSEKHPRQKPAAKPATDEELLKELDAQDDPSVGQKQEKDGEDLGEKADPLTRIGSKMRQAVTLIDREKLSEKTTLLQDEIVQDIDTLIKEQKKKMKQQQQSSSQSQQKQKSQRSSVKPQGQKASQQQQGDGGEQQQKSKDPNQESTERLGKNELKAPQLDPAAQEELLKRVWGLLPEKDREQMRQAAGDEFLPEYESLIIQYFQRLAEEENPQP